MRASLSLQSLIAATLITQLAVPAVAFGQMAQAQQAQEPSMQPQAPTAPPPAASMTKLDGDAKFLQVLNRFTYGPRPGDLDRIRAIGLSAWFQNQMSPEKINDSVLEERLNDYPAMKLPLGKLMEMYPSNQMIRQTMNGRAGSPGGDGSKAVYADQMERYQAKKDGKKQEDMDSATEPLPMPAGDIVALPPDKRFKVLCKLDIAQLRAFRQGLTQDQRVHLTDGMTPQQTETLAAFNSPIGVVAAEDVQVKLLRDIYTERQLQEVMVDFWLNHFNVYMKKSQEAPYFIAAYEREAIRPFALGHFENLLKATAMSPAMLNYLDNASSIGPRSDYAKNLDPQGNIRLRKQPQQQKSVGLNENYGRELMELHTVGVNGGYTQADVTEVAKVFTGWTVGKPHGGDAPAQAQYDPTKHEPGDKFVLGQKIKFDGEREGMAVLHILATSPMTAHFICTKLAVRFVSDTPPPAMVDRMVATFAETQGDIRKVLLTMVNSPEFFTEGNYREKVKTPQDYVVSAVRAAGSDVQSTAGLAEAISDLGMPLYGMQTPNGYSMKADPWNNTAALVSRMNFALALSTNRVAGVSTNFNSLLGGGATDAMTPEEKDLTLEKAILHVPVSDRTQKLILAQTSQGSSQQASELRQVAVVGTGKKNALAVRTPQGRPQDPSTMDTQAALASGLIFGSPEFQRR